MIVDLRTYTAKPGRLGTWFKVYQEKAWDIQRKYLPKCVGFYSVETGVINRAVHLWEYQDVAERERCRAAMVQEPSWPGFVAESVSHLLSQDNRIMKSVPFWPMKPAGQGPFGIVDKRTYHAEPGKLGEFFKIYEREGMEIQVKHLGCCLGFYQSDIGTQHQIVHLWAYKDAADRERRRAAMQADPAWQAYLAKAAPLFTHQENEILRAAPFWKIS